MIFSCSQQEGLQGPILPITSNGSPSIKSFFIYIVKYLVRDDFLSNLKGYNNLILNTVLFSMIREAAFKFCEQVSLRE